MIFFLFNTKVNYSYNISEDYDDILLHISSETETLFRGLNNMLLYDKYVSFISINQASTKNVYDNGIDKYNVGNIISYKTNLSNYKSHFIQGFTEIRYEDNYMSHKLTSSIPLDDPIYLKGKNGNSCIICKFMRLVDNKMFYYIQLTQNFGGYLKDNSYKAISELVAYIIKYYPGDYIFVGDFNVQGHEKIFKYFFSESKYHICDFYKFITCNDNEGIASPDGIVISKNLYKQVYYSIDVYPGYSYQHYMISAKLKIDGFEKTECVLSNKMRNLFDKIILINKDNKENYVNNEGIFEPSKHLGTPDNISKVNFDNNNVVGTIYTNNTLTEKINKIT